MSLVNKNMPAHVKTILRPVRTAFRNTTSSIRMDPDFIIIGAQKSGTTTLFERLAQHPYLKPSLVKEIHYFDGGLIPEQDNYTRGDNWYRSNFPIDNPVHKVYKTYEASPSYLFHPLVPKRIFEYSPKIKLIAILRKPVDRGISHYFHEMRYGNEELEIMPAMLAEEKRLNSVVNRNYRSRDFFSFSYKSRGIYHQQFKRYFKHFDKENILILDSEAVFKRPKDEFNRIFQFIGIDNQYNNQALKAHNVGDNKSKVNSETYEYLKNYFRPHNQILFEMINQKFNW